MLGRHLEMEIFVAFLDIFSHFWNSLIILRNKVLFNSWQYWLPTKIQLWQYIYDYKLVWKAAVMDVINGFEKSILLLTPDGVDVIFRHRNSQHFLWNSWWWFFQVLVKVLAALCSVFRLLTPQWWDFQHKSHRLSCKLFHRNVFFTI